MSRHPGCNGTRHSPSCVDAQLRLLDRDEAKRGNVTAEDAERLEMFVLAKWRRAALPKGAPFIEDGDEECY